MGIIFLLSVAGSRPTLAQDLPNDHWLSRNIAIMHDFGSLWQINTIFKPYRWEDVASVMSDNPAPRGGSLRWVHRDLHSETAEYAAAFTLQSDSLTGRLWVGALLQQPAGSGKPFPDFSWSPYADASVWFGPSLSAHFYLRATGDRNSLSHYTGHPRTVRRLGLNTAEFDHLALTYRQKWLTAQYGRGRQRWGAMEWGNLALSHGSAAYDHLSLDARYKKVHVRFFYGFLESVWDAGNINRYVVGHGLEFANRRNLTLGVSEVVVFSGLNRPPDLAYLNPLAPHIEVELNDRTNSQQGTASANAVWLASLDWLAAPGLRLSANGLVDEFQLDSADRDQGRPDAIAYQVRMAWSRMLRKTAITLAYEYVRVGTFTFRHHLGTNNFVSRELPLGTDLGSDGDRARIGFRAVLPCRVITEVAYGVQRIGAWSITRDPYAAYSGEEFQQMRFPSGKVANERFVEWRLNARIRRSITLSLTGHASISDSEQTYVVAFVNAYLPWWFSL